MGEGGLEKMYDNNMIIINNMPAYAEHHPQNLRPRGDPPSGTVHGGLDCIAGFSGLHGG